MEFGDLPKFRIVFDMEKDKTWIEYDDGYTEPYREFGPSIAGYLNTRLGLALYIVPNEIVNEIRTFLNK